MSDDEDVLRVRGSVVRQAAIFLQNGNADLTVMPELITRIVDEGMWKQRAIPEEGWRLSREFASFEEFVTASPWEGLGTTVEMLQDICHRDPKALSAITEATRRRHGGDRSSKIDNIILAPTPDGTSRATALRRLRKDRPDLHERVLRKELTPHAAMIEAGFRSKTITVPTTIPERVAAALRKHMSPEDLAKLVQLLSGEQ